MPRKKANLRAVPPRLAGVDLKAAEHVTRRLLQTGLAPLYTVLPPPCSQSATAAFLSLPDPFAGLHHALDPASQGTDAITGREYGVPPARGAKKRAQILSIVRAVLGVVEKKGGKGRVLDLCGGCGHVGLVLAALMPEWEIVVVDAKPFSLRVAERRAAEAGLGNVRIAEIDINDLEEGFDVAVALHACGEASDIVLEKAMEAGAGAVVAPCCVGGVVSEKTRGVPGIASAAELGANWGRPRSSSFRSLVDEEEYRLLARAADYGEDSGDGWRRAAKSIVEGDRLAWAEGRGNFVRLVKMMPLTCTPKNDVLVFWPRGWGEVAAWALDEEANAAVKAILGENGVLNGFDVSQVASVGRQLRAEVCAPLSDGEVTFSAAQGSRSRKVVHAVASSLGLHHSSVGKGKKRQVVVRRTLEWPFFFESYLGYGGSWVSGVVRLLGDVPETHAKKRAEVRKNKPHHVTLVCAKEVRALPASFKYDMNLLVSHARRRLLKNPPSLVGLGRVVDPADAENDVWFAVLDWPAAADMRAELGLPHHDMHITLGFAKKDVHDVCKDESTLVELL